MPNWKTMESKERLIAALVASIDKKALNYHGIATYFGDGATYDSIEYQFRKIRGDAEKLKAAVQSSEQEPAPTPKNRARKPAAVLSGRVSKNASPTKKGGTKKGGESSLMGAYTGKEADEFEFSGEVV